MGWILFGSFFILMLISVPIGVSIGIAAVIILLISGIPLEIVPQTMFAGNNAFALVAVPFFVLVGDILARGGISEEIVAFADATLGRLKGGLSIVSIVASMFIAAISGSGAATTAAVGSALIPELKKRKYDVDFSAALIASAGTIGVVIPPSVPMVLYGVIAGESVSKLFMGGFIPGTLMGLALILIAVRMAYKKNYPRGAKVSIGKVGKLFIRALWGLIAPLIVLGGIFSGVFTPSEAAVIAVDYAVFVAFFVYKKLDFKKFYNLVVTAGVTSSLVMFVIATAKVFGWGLAFYQIPEKIASAMLHTVGNSSFWVFLIIDIIILIAGMFMETASSLIILTPIFLPTIAKLGGNLIHFGLMIVIGLAIGMATPPVAINIYMASAITGLSLEKISRRILPMVLALIAVLLIVTYVPSITLYLPNLILSH